MTGDDVATRAVPIERIVSVKPFVVQRRIAFRDCDPAGIVYTPRFLDPIATSAMELFVAELIGGYGMRDEPVRNLDLPAKAVNLVFHNRTSYGDVIDIEVFCSRMGNTTFEVTTAGRDTKGTPLFDCCITLICVRHDPYRSVRIPEYLKDRLTDHKRS